MTIMGLFRQLLLVVCYPPLEKRDDHPFVRTLLLVGAETWPQLLVIGIKKKSRSVGETD